MQKAHIPSSLSATIDRLVGALAPERIVLFGSHANGSARLGSDIDLLVIAEVTGDVDFYLRRAHQLVARTFPRIDLVLCTADDLEQARIGRLPFVQSAIETGMTLYRRT
jgi:predicted nucleotidyltransferase